jgi:aspartyl-tRNA(Asn)/glutamyl-tRNA(Gln) amidotransferase subunit A
VRAIAVNPLNSQEVIIGMTSGNIIKSTDGGLNWRLVKNFDDRVQRIRFYGNNLYALMQNKGLFKSTDAEIVEVSLPNTKYGSLVYAIVCPSEISSNLMRYDGIRYGHVSSEATSLMEVYTKSRAEGFGDEAKRRILTGTYVLSHGYYDAYYKKAQKVRRLIINEFAEIFKQVDVLVAPSSPNVAVPLGKAADDPLFGYIADQLNIPSSLAGLPAISVPAGFALPSSGATPSMDGLPVGLQFIGPQWGEQVLFNLGSAYQSVTDWHTKFPNIN